ncbi:magnesium transporter [Actinomycetaceae bacterium WB03_NA08]|uniref:Magnesium transporter MgtE n=1 Tax=Scrofimicrobium canadense TaxID=2652290 RepID=A0A6N7W7Z3_9ACTO|nr:magnesium transporter [Scrofimicrobium canadense]MSS84386.1 magnesium transporter [Scrofimicrobium canadense]
MFRKTFHPRSIEGRPSVPKTLVEAIDVSTSKAISLWLAETGHDQRDYELQALEPDQAEALSYLLTPESAEELLDTVSPHTAWRFLQKLDQARAAALLDTLDSDDAARIIELMDEQEKQEVLLAMEHAQSASVRGLLAWPEDTAGSRMRPDFLYVHPDSTVQKAVEVARVDPDDLEQGVFVTVLEKEGQRLVGWLSPAALVLGRRDQPVSTLMTPVSKVKQWALGPLDDQEHVARKLRDHDSGVVPVMDGDFLLGVLTDDTVSDIMNEEATEDAERQGGSAPLDIPYMQASPWLLWKKRAPWLLVLFVAEMYTGTVMKAFEDEIAALASLAFFIPLLIGTGGNVGTQITTTLIRTMAQDGVRLRDIGRVLGKELVTGILLAGTLAIAGAIRAWTLGVMWYVILTVTLSLAAIVLWSTLIASVLPLLLKKIGLDPAVVSGPMIATIVDGTGLMIYFLIAKALIPIL